MPPPMTATSDFSGRMISLLMERIVCFANRVGLILACVGNLVYSYIRIVTAVTTQSMTPTLSGLLAQHAYYRPDQAALVFAGNEYTFNELNREVNRLANAWLDCGLIKGDKVATVLPNCFELMSAYWAAAASGIVIVPCSILLQKTV
jgi:non-ribosomal peptide synthetase component F